MTDSHPPLRPRRIDAATLARAKRKAATRLLKLLAERYDPADHAARPGDDPGPDPVTAACEGPLSHLPYGFGLTETDHFPSFVSLLKPAANNARRLDAVEREFQTVVENYDANPRKYFIALLFEVGEHLFMYTDQDLTQEPTLDCIRFSDHGRERYVASLEAFVTSQRK